MRELPHISDAEWDVMKIVWQAAPLTAAEIIERLSGSKPWKPKTTKTLIGRLVQKQALGCNKDNREYLYFPLVSEDECVQAESHSFLQRIFGGSLKPMMAHFLETEKLSSEDIRELKELLQKKVK
ncbi:transcriptional regulator [Paenibacillus sp. MY03]|jgi:BlaI family penicillinase repressor|uniref:Beta-lactamase repressor n=1 Tax=Paenibacillus agaridevorans TaxID=171404 RepID=A0A2R5F0B0_9BACL|nr:MULTISPECIES: BlaI/MecI/CopY family transcriptional regulator [Paenibacillus]OUS74890.1 transcriptional regulator [Paenibacillus sp. MY03]QNK59008.1 BlaI/MecI/CopY family transcriptional regulator [Paenibacillus sp. PAMC21692]GBG10778.1 beta-lactamase repressor [Paenibacillus agaridevorans]